MLTACTSLPRTGLRFPEAARPAAAGASSASSRPSSPHALLALSARRGRGSIAASLFPAHAPRPLCPPAPPAPPQGLASIAASLFPARTPHLICQCRSSVLACPCARAAPAPPASNISSSWPGPQAVRFLLLQPAVHVSLQLSRVSYPTFFILRGTAALISAYPIDMPMSTPIDAPTPNTHCRHRHVSAASLLPGDTAYDFPTTFHVPSKRSACRRLPAQPTETLPCNAQRKRNRSFTPSSAPVHGAFSGTNLDIPDDFPTTFHIPPRRSTRRRLAAQPTEIPRPDVAHADPCQKHMATTSATSWQGGAVEWEVTTHKTPVPHQAVASKARKQNPSSSTPSSGVAMAPAGGGDEVGESGGPSKRHRVERSASGGEKEGQSLGVESGSGKRKDPVMSKGWIEYLEVRCEDSQRIIKEIEDLKSELDEDLRQLGYCEENEKLRAELAVKVKEMHCLMKRIEELEAKNDFLRKRTEELEAINDGLPKQNEELQAKNDDLTKQNKELQARNDSLTKGNEDLQAKNDLHKNIMDILEIQTDAKRKDLLEFLGLYSIMDFPYPQLKSSDEEGNKVEASSNAAAGLSPSSSILEAQTSDAKIQIKALVSQLLSLTQQVVSTDSIQAKDAELATQKEEIKSPKAYLGEESYSNKKDFCQQKIEDGEKLKKVLRATKAILKAISAEKETAKESLKVVQAELEANKSGLAQALSDRDSAHQATGKMKEDITELMNEAGIISASFVLAVFKDHYPDLDMSVINKGFKRDAVKAQELIESFKDLVQPAVKQLEFSYWSDDEESLSS